MICSPGLVVYCRYPFSDIERSKKRPAVVVSREDYQLRYGDVIAIPLTTKEQPPDCYALKHWAEVGLPKRTWVKPILATLFRERIVSELGELSEVDYAEVLSMALSLIDSPERVPSS